MDLKTSVVSLEQVVVFRTFIACEILFHIPFSLERSQTLSETSRLSSSSRTQMNAEFVDTLLLAKTIEFAFLSSPLAHLAFDSPKLRSRPQYPQIRSVTLSRKPPRRPSLSPTHAKLHISLALSHRINTVAMAVIEEVAATNCCVVCGKAASQRCSSCAEKGVNVRPASVLSVPHSGS